MWEIPLIKTVAEAIVIVIQWIFALWI